MNARNLCNPAQILASAAMEFAYQQHQCVILASLQASTLSHVVKVAIAALAAASMTTVDKSSPATNNVSSLTMTATVNQARNAAAGAATKILA